MGDLALPRLALVGNPNCGKTALFNALTGARQKVANYAGVTVERKEGRLVTPKGVVTRVLDLPGTYSLRGRSPDEAVTRDAVLGRLKGEALPDLLLIVADATNLRLALRLVVELRQTNLPMLLVLNMMDLARRRGLDIDLDAMRHELGIPVVDAVAVRRGGTDRLLAEIDALLPTLPDHAARSASVWSEPDKETLRRQSAEAERILGAAVRASLRPDHATDRIDRALLHPVAGVLIFLAIMFLVFQAVFSWAQPLMNGIQGGVDWLGDGVKATFPEGPVTSLIADGLIAGVGAVIVFLPQILILFLFIAMLEDSGYLARAAFLMDKLMGGFGLHGRAFIPLLSSFACAIPGIMAARVIENPRDRLTTILVAPLMTCSARIPVYTLIIAAFVPDHDVFGLFDLRGLVMFGLFGSGIILAFVIALIFKRTLLRGPIEPLMLELPSYKWPVPRNVVQALYIRAKMFLKRAGTTIASLMVIVWAISSYPLPPDGATGPAIDYSLAGMIGHALEPLFRPLGFDWRITIALIAGLPAREVMVGVLGTIFALSSAGKGNEDALAAALSEVLSQTYTLPTALALLAWYVSAPQCLSTISVVRRETGGWRWALVLFGYALALAYLSALIVNQIALRLV